MRFDLTLQTILAFFVPGVIVITGVCLVFTGIRTFISPLVEEPKTAGIFLIFGICFVIGILVDSLRTITIEKIVTAINRKIGMFKVDELPDYIPKITRENLPVFKMLTDATQTYYRMNANAALAFLCIFLCRLISLIGPRPFNYWDPIILLTSLFVAGIFVCVAAGVRREVILVMIKFTDSN